MSDNKSSETLEPEKPRRISPLEQIRSQRNWNLERLNKAFLRNKPGRFFDFLTVGTSNKRPEELLALLKLPVFSCNKLIDIRSNPNSIHTPCWNKTAISDACGANAISYVHRPDLGVPGNIRKLLYSGQFSYEQFFSWYDDNVLVERNLHDIVETVRSDSSAFMCTEIGPTFCHRHRLALKLEAKLGYVSFDL